MKPSKDAARPSALAINPHNREAWRSSREAAGRVRFAARRHEGRSAGSRGIPGGDGTDRSEPLPRRRPGSDPAGIRSGGMGVESASYST